MYSLTAGRRTPGVFFARVRSASAPDSLCDDDAAIVFLQDELDLQAAVRNDDLDLIDILGVDAALHLEPHLYCVHDLSVIQEPVGVPPDVANHVLNRHPAPPALSKP